VPQRHAIFTSIMALVSIGAAVLLYSERGTEGATPKLTGADIAEIQQLSSRYNGGWDFRDPELYLSAYTDDGVFTTGAGEPYAGKKAMRDYLMAGFEKHVNGDATHNSTTVLIEPTPEGAKGRVYWYVINVLSQPPAITGSGHYKDTYVKTSNGWRIKTRTSVRGWPKR